MTTTIPNRQTPQLGDRVRDRLSGFAGIVHAESTFLNGCIRQGVVPPLAADGAFREPQWFDRDQLEVTEAGVEQPHPSIRLARLPDAAMAPTGGPRPDHPAHSRDPRKFR